MIYQGEDKMTTSAPKTTFSFRRRYAQIDWRSLASIDVDRIAQEMDVQTLQQNIMNVTFCNALSEEFHNVDPNFMKLFRLAQLIIEYLLFTQQYLTDQLSIVTEGDKKNKEELSALKTEIDAKQKELVLVKKENRKRRKMIEKYQQMLKAGATGFHSCSVCGKEFISNEYLRGHVTRRHPDHVTGHVIKVAPKVVESTAPDIPQIDQEEIKSQILQQLNERLLQSESNIRESLSAKSELQAIQEKLHKLTLEKQQEQDRAKFEFQEYRTSILNELHQQKQETESLQEALQAAQDELATIKKEKARKVSYLGHLEGAEEIDLTGKKAQEEVTKIKDMMQSELDEMKGKLKKQKSLMKEKFEKLSGTHRKQLAECTERVKTLEETCMSCLNTSDKTLKENFNDLQKSTHTSPVAVQVHVSPPPSPHVKHRHTQHIQEVENGDNDDNNDDDDSDEVSLTTDDDGLDESTDNNDNVNNRMFIPFKHRPYITCKFDHDPNQLERVRHAVVGLVDKSIKKRGIPEDKVGLSDEELARKCELLNQERDTKEKIHYDFQTHREELVTQVDQIINEHYQPPKVVLDQLVKSGGDGITGSATPKTKRSFSQQPSIATTQTPVTTPPASPSLQHANRASPAPVTASPLKRKEYSNTGGVDVLVTPPISPSKITNKQSPMPTKHVTIGGSALSPVTKRKPPVHVKGSKEQLTDDSLTELTSSSLDLSPVKPKSTQLSTKGGATTSSKAPVNNNDNGPILVKPYKPTDNDDDSDWDSDSNDEGGNDDVPTNSSKAVVDNKNGPILVKPYKSANNDDDSDWDSDSNEGGIDENRPAAVYSSTPKQQTKLKGPDPSKRPPGGVPVMIMMEPHNVSEEDSDTFTLSDKKPRPPSYSHKDIDIMDIPTIGGEDNTPPPVKNKSGSSATTKKVSTGQIVSTTMSSRSALTSVTNTMNDDFDSDLSELDLATATVT